MKIELDWPDPIPQSQIDIPFLQGMLDRMATGYYMYGSIRDSAIKKRDMLASLRRRLTKYEETGNTEWLMDVANIAMIEFVQPSHPQAHFKPTDSHESPGFKWKDDNKWSRTRHNRDL